MSDSDLDRRLRAVERALTGDDSVPDLADDAELVARVDAVQADVDTLAARVDDLDAGLQAVRGYVGQLEHVNERVERRANAACAAVDRLEAEEVARPEPAAGEYRPAAPIANPSRRDDQTDADDESQRDDDSIDRTPDSAGAGPAGVAATQPAGVAATQAVGTPDARAPGATATASSAESEATGSLLARLRDLL